MSIPEEQLKTWAQQKPLVDCEETFGVVKQVLEDYFSNERIDFTVYLQGSCKNITNIKERCDVDIVVELKDTFISNISKIQLSARDYIQAQYLYQHFKRDVRIALQDKYGKHTVEEKGESLKVISNSLPLTVNILPCILHKYFEDPNNYDNYTDGIAFLTKKEKAMNADSSIESSRSGHDEWLAPTAPYMPAGSKVDNPNLHWTYYIPELHFTNGKKKDSNTEGMYKAVIRIFKNLQEYLVGTNVIREDIISSYFLESLLYNVPDSFFAGNYEDVFYKITVFLSTAKLDKFICQNGHTYLFGLMPEQWTEKKAVEFIDKSIEAWNNY